MSDPTPTDPYQPTTVVEAAAEQPERIGHPGGLADEPNYVRLLLAPFGLYPVSARREARES